MIAVDYTILIVMAVAAATAAGSFCIIAGYLFDRDLADRSARATDILGYYKTYMRHTQKKTGRIGGALWVHGGSAGIFISTGVIYTIFRFILPHFF